MKNLLVLFVLLLCQIGFSQEGNSPFIEKGHWGLSGSVGFSSRKSENIFEGVLSENKSTSLSVSPNLFYSFADNWMAGIGLNYTYTNSDSDVNATHGIGIAPNVQRYFPIAEKFAFSLNASIEYFRSKDPYSETEYRIYKNYSANIRPGFSYLLNKKVAIEMNTGLLSYAKVKGEWTDNRSSELDKFDFNLGFTNLQIGAIIFF